MYDMAKLSGVVDGEGLQMVYTIITVIYFHATYCNKAIYSTYNIQYIQYILCYFQARLYLLFALYIYNTDSAMVSDTQSLPYLCL